MSDKICMDCGMILPADTKVCTVCGYDNKEQPDFELPTIGEPYPSQYEDIAPENYPGF